MNHIVTYNPERVQSVIGQSIAVYPPSRKDKWYWIHRLCYGILNRIGAIYNREHYSISTEFKTIVLDLNPITDLLIEHRISVERLFETECKYVVMGREQMHRLHKDFDWHTTLNYNIQYHLNGRKSIMGLTIVCVPWIDGMFVLPDLEKSPRIG